MAVGDTTLITPHNIAQESLIVLENELVLAGLVHRAYSKEYQHGVGSTVSIRKPWTVTDGTVSTSTVNMATVTESSVDVVLNTHLDLTVEITTQELTMDIVDFSEQVIQPIMRARAQAVDAQLALLFRDVAAHYAVSSTPAVSDISGIRAVQGVMKVPMGDRRMVVHPMTEADYMHLDAFLHAEKRGDGGKALREASMGRVLGYDWYMSQNIQTHTPGDPTGGTATILLKGAGASAATVATVDAAVSGSTINAYDVFKVVGYDQWHVISVNATANVGTHIVSFQPAFAGARTDDSTVTFQRTAQRANLAFHKNAFALVTAPLAPPIGGAKAAVLNYKGLSCRVVYDYAIMSKKNVISVDMLLGTKTLDRDLAARLIDGR